MKYLLCTLIFFTPAFSISAQSLSHWTYIQVDSTRDKWGDYAEPNWLRYFGLAMGDMTNDKLPDILAGRHIYVNPGNDLSGTWVKQDVGMNVDGIFVVDVDGDEYGDIIGMALPDVYWLEAEDKAGTSWRAKKVAEVPATSHVNSQGFTTAQLDGKGKPELLIAGAGDIYALTIPDNPAKGEWPQMLVGKNTSDEGIGTGDLDGDGDIDIAAGSYSEKNKEEPTQVVWFANPGDGSENWETHVVGRSNHAVDRVEVADLNGDGRSDVVIAEERYPGKEADGNLFWYENPASSEEDGWTRHLVVTQYSMNNLAINDLDNDGDIDILTSEHKGADLALQAWSNDGQGNFTKNELDTGKESHLGTQLADLDNDGDLDIVSVGWDQPQYLHLWRNDNASLKISWKHYSTENKDLPVPNSGGQQTASLATDLDKDGVFDFVITERTAAPSVVWYKKNGEKWDRMVVEDEALRIEAGSAHYDIDGDGDEDIVFAGESQSNEVWWWANPYPNYDQPWERHTIKKSGSNKHHDQLFGDFDGDGQQELVFWNQQGKALFIAEIPENPQEAEEWNFHPIYKYSTDSQMEQLGQEGHPGWKDDNEHEGLAKADIDGDGTVDIIGGGRWFKHTGEGEFSENIVDASYVFTRAVAGQIIEGGRPEIILVVGDGVAPMILYEYREGTWHKNEIVASLNNGHTIDLLDFNQDGHLDLFSAEMRFGEGNPDSKIRILLGDGQGNFNEHVVATGYGVHEGRLVDLDGDGDYDVLGKPYSWKTPRLDVWINEGTSQP